MPFIHKVFLAVSLLTLSSTFSVAQSKYHFLWVIDNGMTMKEHRDILKQEIDTFIDTLNSKKKISYKMAITTTDMFTDKGKLVANDDALTIVDSRQKHPERNFASLIDSMGDVITSFWAQGLETSYQAIKGNKTALLEKNVPLIVIYISNKNDYSCKGMKDGGTSCNGREPWNNPDWVAYPVSRYSNYFKALKTTEDVEVSVYTITGLPNSPCATISNGQRYQDVQAKLGSGANLDVCKSNFRESLKDIASRLSR